MLIRFSPRRTVNSTVRGTYKVILDARVIASSVYRPGSQFVLSLTVKREKIGKLDHPFPIEQLPPSIYRRT